MLMESLVLILAGGGIGRCTDIPALREDDSQEERDEEHDGADPAVGSEGGRFVEVCLVLLCSVSLLQRSGLACSLSQSGKYAWSLQ
jgi:hypothetical protein